MNNTSGLSPRGHSVLVAPYEPEMHRGLIEIPLEVRQRTSMIEQRATMVEVGPMAWHDERVRFLGIPLWRRLRAKPGERVLVSKYAGFQAVGPADGKLYRVVNANDVFCAITSERDLQIEKHEATLNEIDLTGRSGTNG